jgi:hypothetical protein
MENKRESGETLTPPFFVDKLNRVCYNKVCLHSGPKIPFAYLIAMLRDSKIVWKFIPCQNLITLLLFGAVGLILMEISIILMVSLFKKQ